MSRHHLWKTKFSKIPKFFLVFLVIFSWIFSGWPQIFNPSTLFRAGFPPNIQETVIFYDKINS